MTLTQVYAVPMVEAVVALNFQVFSLSILSVHRPRPSTATEALHAPPTRCGGPRFLPLILFERAATTT